MAIAFGVLLGAVLLGNLAWCFMFKRREKPPNAALAGGFARDPYADEELGRLQ